MLNPSNPSLLYGGNWGAWCGQGVNGLGSTIVNRYRIGIIYNNEVDCISVDASFGIGGDCYGGANPSSMVAPGGYASTCPVAGQYAACCCILPGNCYNQWGYFSVWILANTPPSCQAGYYCPTPFGMTPYTAQYICPPGFYCPALSTTYLNTPCSGGYWGGVGQTAPSCSGQCSAGYFCPAGSTSSTTSVCGGVGLYCPAGSASPIAVGSRTDIYTTPGTAASSTTQTGFATCPSDRACSGGQLLPGVIFSSGCAGGAGTATAYNAVTNAAFGPTIVVSTQNYFSGVTWAINSVVPVDAGCNVTVSSISLSPLSSVSATLKVGVAPVLLSLCPNGFTVGLTAVRVTQPSQSATCSMAVAVSQFIGTPTITNCGSRSIVERSASGTFIGAAFSATNPNVGTSITWAFVSPPNGLPISIGLCDGQLRVITPFTWAAARSYSFSLQATNDGTAIGLSKVVSAVCSITVNVIQSALAPILAASSFFTTELLPAGTPIGSVLATDPANYTISNYSWAAVDSPNVFNISLAGTIQNSAVVDSLALSKGTWAYTVTVCSLYACGSYPISIVVAQTVRPPVVPAQNRTIAESAPGGFIISPPLSATQPQSLPFNFSLSPTNVFGITPAGSLFLQPGASLSYRIQSLYTMTVSAFTASGATASNFVSVLVTEVYKPPAFVASVFSTSLNESSTPGVTAYTLVASSTNTVDQLTYSILSVNPAGAASWFSIVPQSGAVQVSAGVPGGALLVDRALTYPAGAWTVNISVCVTNAVRQTNNASLLIAIANISPRVNWVVNATIAGNASALTPVATLSPAVWTAYSPTSLTYSLVSATTAGFGLPAFVLRNASTSAVAVANVSFIGIGGGRVSGPDFNQNLQPVLVSTWQVADINTGRAALGTLAVSLQHSNRVPYWNWTLPQPTQFVTQQTGGPFGTPLSAYVVDLDLALNVGEVLTFAIVGGNSNGAFSIDPSTGRLSVVDTSKTVGIASFNLTVSVRDAGIDGPAGVAFSGVNVTTTLGTFPPIIASYNFSVPELSATGTPVGVVTGWSVNFNLSLTYSLTPIGYYATFPFIITTVPSSSGTLAATGAIAVAPGVAVNTFSAGPRVYQATLSVQDNNPASNLVTQSLVAINVSYVPMAPYFNAVTQVPASASFQLQVDELSPVGTPVLPATSAGASGSPILGYSKDSWAILSYSWAFEATGCSGCFAINSSTAAVTLGPNGGALNFNSARAYNLTVRVTYAAVSMSDTAVVTVWVREVNKPSVWGGLYDPSSGTLVTAAVVSESAPPGTAVGRVAFVDPNTAFPWNARVYALLPQGPGAGFFTMNASSGLISVAQPGGGLYYWDYTNFSITVSCTDLSAAPLTTLQTITVLVAQVNTVSIAGFSLPASTPPSAGQTLAPGVVAFTTNGSTIVEINGAGFGPTARRLAADPSSAVAVSATYGPATAITMFSATACAVYTPNTVIRCTTAPGSGSGHAWAVSIDNGALWNATTVGVATTSYLAPSISGVNKWAGTGYAGSNRLLTAGGELLSIDGLNLAYSATEAGILLSYGPTGSEFGGTCTMHVRSSRVICITAPGIGGALQFRVRVGGQWSPLFNSTTVAYAPPSVSAVAVTSVVSVIPGLMDTRGGDTLTITGTNLGPSASTVPSDFVVRYSANISDLTQYVATAVSCAVPAGSDNIALVCTTAPGAGAGLYVSVSVGGQTAQLSTGTIAYRPPVLTGDISGRGADLATSSGGELVVLSGDQLGPLTSTLWGSVSVPAADATYGAPGGYRAFSAVSCAVTTAHTVLSCMTAPGTGKGLLWNVTIAGQTSPTLTSRPTSYAPPVTGTLTGPGSNVAHTYGYEAVVIGGLNFGPWGTPINGATYGVNGTELSSPGCALTIPHTQIVCNTTVGAGAGLVWFVTVDGQRSVSPSTNYGPPIISGFAGAAANASTNGGDIVLINGTFFSTQKYLGPVTYGPSGTEFSAMGCNVTMPHSQVACFTAPGTGRVLRWLVNVAGQVSALSTAYTSYAAPALATLTPTSGLTNGGARATLMGVNLGTAYAASKLVIKVNSAMQARPPTWGIWLAAALAGQPSPAPEVDAWLGGLYTVPPLSSQRTGSVENVSFFVPSGFGPAAEVLVLVDGVPSNLLTFSYNPPLIFNVAPDRQNVSAGLLRVFIDGASFCDGTRGCGVALVNGATVLPTSWAHDEVLLVIPDLPAGGSASVQLFVGGQASNVANFSKLVPNINALVMQGVWTAMDTRGGEFMWIAGVFNLGATLPVSVTIGGRMCTNLTRFVDNNQPPDADTASFTIRFYTPAGYGQNLPVIISVLSAESRSDNGIIFSYAPPRISDLSLSSIGGRRRAALFDGVPTLGANLTITGADFSSDAFLAISVSLDSYGPNPMQLRTLVHTDTQIVVAIPPGDGPGHTLAVVVDGRTSNATYFAYSAPIVTGTVPTHGPTSGGTLVTITGSNFGLTAPSIFFNGVLCNNVLPFIPSPLHNTLQCRSPVGTGTNLPIVVVVSSLSSAGRSTPVLWSYDPPTVTSILPAFGPTAGAPITNVTTDSVNYELGPPVIITVRGTNLGNDSSTGLLTLVQPASEADAAVAQGRKRLTDVTVSPLLIVSWNHTTVVFRLPPGSGVNLRVQANVSTQTSVDDTEFSYAPPSVLHVIRFDKSPAECAARPLCFSYGSGNGAEQACTSIPAGCYGTEGGYKVAVIGESFGAESAAVTIGGRLCAPVSPPPPSHILIVCSAPQGLGVNLPVIVTVGNRSSAFPTPTGATFTYDEPIVNFVSPNPANALGGGTLTVRGKNFGFVESPVSIKIANLTCNNAAWGNDGVVTCQPQQDVVGPKNLEILAALRSSPIEIFDYQGYVVFQCAPSFYGLVGELCLACPEGASCPGGELETDLVQALPSFWRYNLTVPDSRCDPIRNGPTRAIAGCPWLAACAPAESCLGNNTCAVGYTGDRCSACETGYYRFNNVCAVCPSSPWAVIVGFVVGALAALSISYGLNKSGISLTLIAVGVDYAQVLSVFAQANIKWPAVMKQLFTIFSAFSLNLDLAAPECAAKSITYPLKWTFVELLPLIALTALFSIYATVYLYKRCCMGNRKKGQLHSHLPILVSSTIVMLRVLYIYLTRMSLDVFNCVPTSPPDGKTYMSGQLQYPCGGSVQNAMLFPALVAFVGYSIALPSVGLWFLRRKRSIVKYDMIIWAKGLGNDRLTNKHFSFRKTWSQLYHHMKPGKMYWEFVILARKLAIVSIAVGLRGTSSYQLAMMLLVLFAAFCAQVKNNPYFSHADKQLVVAEHESKRLTDPLHIAIDLDMRALAKANSRKGARVQRFFDVSTMRKDSYADAALLVALDYNTVESVMLGSAILVCVAGLMFSSDRFVGANLAYYANEYNGLAFVTIFIVCVSIVYYGFMFIVDMLLVLKPDAALRLFSVCKSKDKMLEAAAVRRAKAGGGGGAGGRPKAESDAGGENAVNMTVNPALLAQRAAAGAASSTSTVEQIAEMVEAPNEVQWAAIRGNVSALATAVKTLTAENAALKQAAARAQTAAEDAVLSGSALSGIRRTGVSKRTEFGQVPVAAAPVIIRMGGSGSRESRAPSVSITATDDAGGFATRNPMAAALAGSGGAALPTPGVSGGAESPAFTAGMGSFATRNPLSGAGVRAAAGRSTRRLGTGSAGSERELGGGGGAVTPRKGSRGRSDAGGPEDEAW